MTFPVWAFASDGAKGSRVAVHFPAGYDVVRGERRLRQPRPKAADGGVTLSTQPLGEPLTYFAYVTAQREAVYKATPLTVDAGGRSIDLVVRGWRDDPAWAGRIGGLFRKALPQLTREIGLPWPETPADRGPGGRQPGGRRVCRAVRPGRAADRGRLLGRPAGRAPRGGARLVQRRRSSPTAGRARGSRRCTPSARPGKLKVRDTSPKLTAAVKQGRDPAQRLAEHRRHRRRRRPPDARPTATRPPSRSPARSRSAPGTTPSSGSGPRRATRVGAYQPETAARVRRRRRPRDGRRPARLARPARPARDRDRQGLHRPVAQVGDPARGGRAARRPRRGADRVRPDARARRRLAAAARHPRRPARVAVRRGRAAAGRRADRARAARRDRVAGRSWRADAAAGRPAALPGGRHGRRLARGGGGAQRDAHGHAGRGRPGPRRRPAEPDRDARRGPGGRHRDGPGGVHGGRPRGRPVGGGRRLSRLDRRRGRRDGGAPCWSTAVLAGALVLVAAVAARARAARRERTASVVAGS